MRYNNLAVFQIQFQILCTCFGYKTVAGSVESIAEITAETLYQCHEAFYTPSNMVLCVAGNVEPQKVCDMAREILPS